ncbi:glycogen synthase [Candidatus Gottesmanbacteria bacterium]|nr:glycogen synthase [Candidatus Gottesmanbacteria bacterium]
MALKETGVDIRIIIPYYKVLNLGKQKRKKIGQISCRYGGVAEKVEIYEVHHPISDIPVYLLKNKKYLNVANSLDTYPFFSFAVVAAVKTNAFSWTPAIIHCNDLHTGLIPLLLKEYKMATKSMLTIHNISYQGRTGIEVVHKLGIDQSRCHVVQWEIESKKINVLLEGIIHADIITTVSPTYAREIMTEEYGAGLEDIIRGKEAKVFGILNGIDNDWRYFMYHQSVKYPYVTKRQEFPPATPKTKLYDWKEGKRRNKLSLQRKLGLKVDGSLPLLSFIGRLDPQQKGIDILHKMLRRIDLDAYEFVILGTGDVHWQERYEWLSKFFPKHISCNFVFDEALAHQIYAGSDFVLIPSKFEPCGLIQMIAMLFGTLPIAHKVGGLADSISDRVNGFLFNDYSAEALEKAVNEGARIWKSDPVKYENMVEAAMRTDFSWNVSAAKYVALYEKLATG